MNLKLYSRYQNSAGQRVRTALNLKGVDYTYVGVGPNGAISQEDYNRDVNPQGLILTLSVDGELVTKSTALIEFIEETLDGPFVPRRPPYAGAVSGVRAGYLRDASDRVKAHHVAEHGQNDADWERWYDHWAHHGYQTLEKQLEARTTKTLSPSTTNRPSPISI